MLQLSGSLLNKPILSLRTGGQIATITQAIMSPYNLKIEGFYCTDTVSHGPLILLTQDIRDILSQGIVVNDFEVLTQPEELVRLEKILRINFQLIGKPVVTVGKHRVGKVIDFAADTSSFYVQKLYVSQSIFKSLNTGQLSIDRTQIVEISPKKITIQELLKGQKAPLSATAPAS
jgi:uncharacterized protein YrrD